MDKNAVDLPRLAASVDAMSAEDAIRWALETFHPRAAFASSFGAEDVVVTDLLVDVRKDARIFTLDTGRLHEETHQIMERVRDRFGVAVETYVPDRAALERLLREKGSFSFFASVDNRKECCGIRKVEPLKRALSGLDLWITGLRRAQGQTRQEVRKLEWDETFGLLKLNPLADWSEERVWEHIRTRGLPYNVLHDRGYPSIGCAPCTRAVREGEDIRSGRWWWEQPSQKECGLHARRTEGATS